MADLDDLISDAVAILRSATEGGASVDFWPALAPARYLGRPALEAGTRLLWGDLAEQEVGCLLLRLACHEHDDWRLPATQLLLPWANATEDPAVCSAVAGALGELGQPQAIEGLVVLSRHADEDVRSTAAASLATCSGPDYHGTPLVIETLLGLMSDPADGVRDWATFALGSQLMADSARIRQGLAARLDDHHQDTRQEALVGLARRRDARALAATAAALRSDEVFLLDVEAAEWLGDPRLHPRLVELRAQWEPGALGIDAAVAACDPETKLAELATMAQLLDELSITLATNRVNLVPRLQGDVCELGSRLSLIAADDLTPSSVVWDFHRLMLRAGDSGVVGAAALVVSDLESVSLS